MYGKSEIIPSVTASYPIADSVILSALDHM